MLHQEVRLLHQAVIELHQEVVVTSGYSVTGGNSYIRRL